MRPSLLIGSALALSVAALIIYATARPTDHVSTSAHRAAVNPHVALSTLLRSADPSAGASLFGQCAACHSIGREGPDLEGPNLYGVVGSGVAERRRLFAYSAALRQVGGEWTFARLNAWLISPAAFAPGTKMAFSGLADARDRADVIAYLNAQGSHLATP